MRFTPFEYMHWAKGAGNGSGHRLTRSGLLAPPAGVLGDPEGLLELAELEPYGPPDLKEHLAARAHITPDRVFLVGGSSSMALFLIGIALLERDDLVLAESPGYESLHRFAQFPGARVESLARDMARDGAIDMERLVAGLDQGATMVVLTDLHNPSGARLDPAQLEEVVRLTDRAGAWLVVDEVFAEFLPPDARGPSLVNRGERVITLASFTKAFGVGSLRQGWLFAAPPVIRRCEMAYDLMGVLSPTVPLLLLGRLLEREGAVRAWVETELAGLDQDLEGLAAHPLLEFTPPAGGVSIFPAITGCADTEPLCRTLSADHDVHVTPGRFFGDPARIRIGLGLAPAARGAALTALTAGLDKELKGTV